MKKISFTFIFMLILSQYSFAEDSHSYSPYLEFSPQSTLHSELSWAPQEQVRDSNYVKLMQHPDYILPKKALLFSVLIPGSGELYCGSYIKGLTFLGIEIAAWTMYVGYHKKGKEKEDEFEEYADTYWNEDKWRAWFNSLTSEQQQVFSHSLPETKTQQYYEMIGKYNQFLVGWDGVDLGLSFDEVQKEENTSPLREHYMDMRAESNNLLKRATTGAYIAMFNHVISAIDAAWTAKRHNKKLVVNTSLRFENKYFNNEDHTMLSLKIDW